MCAKSLHSCLTLCDTMDCSSPGSSVHAILQARTLGVGCHFLLQCMKVKSESEVAQSCPTLSDPMDCSLLGSSVHGMFQARVLEWGAIAFPWGVGEGHSELLRAVSRELVCFTLTSPLLLPSPQIPLPCLSRQKQQRQCTRNSIG